MVKLPIRRRFFLGLLAVATPARADTLTVRVVGVSDGDTITALDAGKTQHRVRLAAIDAPEKGQPFGNRPKENLSRLVYGKEVLTEWDKKDRYGRIVGTVWVVSPNMPCRDKPDCPKTLDAGLAQLTVGLAGQYKKYAHE